MTTIFRLSFREEFDLRLMITAKRSSLILIIQSGPKLGSVKLQAFLSRVSMLHKQSTILFYQTRFSVRPSLRHTVPMTLSDLERRNSKRQFFFRRISVITIASFLQEVSYVSHPKGRSPSVPQILGPPTYASGSVAEWLGRWTCDQQVAGSNPGLPAVECNPGQVVNRRVPLSPSSII